MNEQITKHVDLKDNKPVRKTHCFNCKENIDSQQWDVCDRLQRNSLWLWILLL